MNYRSVPFYLLSLIGAIGFLLPAHGADGTATVMAVSAQPELRDAAFWQSKYQTLSQEYAPQFTPPPIGSIITIQMRIGSPVRGTIDSLSDKTVTVDGRIYKREDIALDTCAKLFAFDWSRSQARKIVIKEKQAYELAEKKRQKERFKEIADQTKGLQSAMLVASGQVRGLGQAISNLDSAIQINAGATNIKDAQVLLSRLKEKHEFAFGVDTDIFKQRRTYTIASDINLGYKFQLKVRATMPGLEVVRPAAFDFHFISSSDDWKFLEYHPLIFISDDQRYSWESGEVSHNGDVGRGYVLEQMHVNMPYDQFKQLAYARVVQGRLGIYEFTISDIDREQMRILFEFFESEGK